jgi:hypothetical protein
LKVRRDVVEDGAVARSHNRALTGFAQGNALAHCERHEIMDVIHDCITQLGGSR